MAQSPTSRTLQLLRSKGWVCQIVERRVPFNHITQDLFGFIDILCLTGNGIVGVQCTSAAHHQHRVKKITTDCRKDWLLWLRSGGKVLVVSWRKTTKKQRRKWLPRAEWVVQLGESYKVIPFAMDEEVRQDGGEMEEEVAALNADEAEDKEEDEQTA